jgi:photosystem II stability/assembly factor-like uncharacterized protein
MYSVCFTDADTGYAVGEDAILRTTNGGTNWTLIGNCPLQFLYSVHFTNASTGYAVGTRGTILKIKNGGSDVSLQNLSFTGSNVKLCFPDANTGYALEGGTLYKTTNAGENWTTKYIDSINYFFGIYFTDTSTGYIAGRSILKTTDGGTSWTNQYNDTCAMYSIFFTDAFHGYAVGQRAVILNTTNGGMNWTMQRPPSQGWFASVFFTDSHTGYAVGGYQPIMKTTDGGLYWTNVNNNYTGSEYLDQVFFPDDTTGYIVGHNRLILKTSDAGSSWTILSQGVYLVTSVFFTDVNTGYIVGSDGLILNTTDGGVTWTKMYSGTSAWLYDVVFTDKSTGYVSGASGALLKTTWGPLGIIAQSSAPLSLSVYPNPAVNNITIETLGMTGTGCLVFYNINGQEVVRQNISNSKTQIDVGNLDSGVYFVKLKSDNFVEVKKFIKI